MPVETNDYIKSITDHTADALITIDKKGLIQSVNPACEKMFGYSADEIVGQNVSCLMPKDIASEHDTYLKNYLNTHQAKIIGIGRYLNARHKHGKIIPIHLSVSEIKLGDETYFSGVIKNKSSVIEKDTFEEWQTKRKYLEKAEHAAGIGHWHIDLKTQKIFWSEETYLIHGLRRNEFTPNLKNIKSLYHPDDVEFIETHINNTFEEKKDFAISIRIIRPNQEIRYVQVFGEPEISEKGDVTAIFGVFRDITELKQAEEELERSNEELESFAFTVSHDLKAPLRHISMSATFLDESSRDKLEGEELEFLNIMTNSAKKAQFMIDNLLNYARINHSSYEFQKIGLNDVLKSVTEILQLDITENNVTLEISPLPSIIGNEGLLIRLFQNMIENAIKYQNNDTPPHISIWSRKEATYDEIILEDNGIGIAPEFAEKIFLMFQRLHGESSPYKGMGIGLAICRRIMQAHNGKMRLDTDYKNGARFILSFPRERTKTDREALT